MKKGGLSVKIVPNPFHNQVKLAIRCNKSLDEVVQVTVTDVMGRTLYQTHTTLQKGYNELTIDEATTWATGVYSYTVRSAVEDSSALFVKQ